jgi:hypothetical protein
MEFCDRIDRVVIAKGKADFSKRNASGTLAQNRQEGIMAYCALGDLQAAYGEDRIAGWSRLNPDTADIADSGGGN